VILSNVKLSVCHCQQIKSRLSDLGQSRRPENNNRVCVSCSRVV